MTQAKLLADSSDEAGRKRLTGGFRNLSYLLETPDDTLQRIMYVNAKPTHHRSATADQGHKASAISAVRIGIDLELFDLLAANEYR